MSSIRRTLEPVLAEARDELVEVGAILERTPPDEIDGAVPGMDLKLRGVYQRLEAARKLMTLYRTPQPKNYDPARVLREAAGQVAVVAEDTGVLRAARVCHGDAELVVECLRVITGTLGQVRTTVMPGEEPPRVLVERQGTLPAVLTIDGIFELDWEEVAERWRAATGGGEVQRTGRSIVLTLDGQAERPESVPGLEPPLKALKRAVIRLRSWRGAIGHYEPGYASSEDIVALYRETVEKTIAAVEQVLEKV